MKQLANLLSRGRQLHWSNAVKLAHAQADTRLPNDPPGIAVLVYQAVQLLIATDFIERRGYLRGPHLDKFGATLFQRVAGAHLARVHGLVQNYAAVFDDEAAFVGVVSRDLSHALFGRTDDARATLLAGTPRAMLKTTHLYCAQVFADAEIIRRLS